MNSRVLQAAEALVSDRNDGRDGHQEEKEHNGKRSGAHLRRPLAR
jgi:hypothetical protein